MKKILGIVLTVCFVFVSMATHGATDKKNDPHYNAAGFFDLHVCNWPNRKPFILAVFTTYQFDKLKSVTVHRPDGSVVGVLDPARYRVIQKKGKPEKRGFLTQFEITDADKEGWYSATIEFKDGTRHTAKDVVTFGKLGIAGAVFPKPKQELDQPPAYLEWDAIPGAGFYRVYVRDIWNGNELIYQSKIVNTNRVELPKGLLVPGGLYNWRIQARDVNEDVKLGDFNLGSLSGEIEFGIK